MVMDPGGPSGASTYYEMALVGNRIVASVYVGTSYELRTVTLPPSSPPSEGTVLHQFPSAGARQDETLVADATHAYWSSNSIPYTVYRKPLDNPAANIEPVFTAPTGGYIYELVMTATAFYYWGWTTTGYGLFTAAKSPGDPVESAQGITGLVPLYNSQSVGGLVIAGSRLFWASYNNTDVEHQFFTAPAGGGAPQTVDDTIQNYSYVGSIKRAAIAAPTVVQNVALAVSYPDVGLAVDATHVYFMDNSGTVWRALKDGSAASQRVLSRSGSPYLTSIEASDADYLYGPGSNGAVVRVNKTP
jgi:hypothetical protein